MTRFAIIAAAAVAAVATAAPAAAIDVKQVQSPGGIKAWLVQDRSTPIISISFAWRAGSVYDPKGKGGTARLVANLLTEGAGDMNARAFQRALEAKSITISFSASFDRFRGTFRTLTRNKAEAFRLLRLALTEPRFDAKAIERERTGLADDLARQQRNPRYLATRAWYRAAYGGHPYGRLSRGTADSIKAITRADLLTFVRHHLARNNLYIGVVGDISPAELARVLDQVFGGLPAKARLGPVPRVLPKANGGVTVVRFPIPQSVVIFGHSGIPRRHKDFITAYLLNQILGGGGMTSRLYLEVREKRGLAYAVYSYLQPFDFSAAYMGGVATRNRDVAKTIGIIRQEWKRMAEKGVTQEELEAVKKYLTGSYPLRFSTSQRIATLMVARQIQGFTPSYFNNRNNLIRAVTLKDIQRVARTLLQPDRLTFVVVGNPQGKI
jgi:zinc protease